MIDLWSEELSEDLFQRLVGMRIYTPLQLIFAPEEEVKKLGLEGMRERYSERGLYSNSYRIIWRSKEKMKISTGCKEIDDLLDGIHTSELTEFYGRSSVGKTQICFQLCVTASQQMIEMGRGGTIIFIDTVGTFRPERIMEMADLRGINGEKVLERIMVMSARNVGEQLNLEEKLVEAASSLKVRLILIDTLTENFLYEYRGEQKLIKRQSLLAHHLHNLILTALKHNLAIVTTNSVRAHGDILEEVGGNIVKQMVHRRVWLERVEDFWRASLGNKSVYFQITHKGIVGLTQPKRVL